MVLDLIDEFDPLLRTKTEAFNFKSPPCDPIELANNLIETLQHTKALGISANQVGLPYSVFALWSEQPLVCFNPRVVDTSQEVISLEESCATYPHMVVKIKRPKMIKVRFYSALGEMMNEKFTGMTARIFQHEMDHMQGLIHLQRANTIHIDRARNQQKQILRAAKRGELTMKQFDGSQYEQKIQIQ